MTKSSLRKIIESLDVPYDSLGWGTWMGLYTEDEHGIIYAERVWVSGVRGRPLEARVQVMGPFMPMGLAFSHDKDGPTYLLRDCRHTFVPPYVTTTRMHEYLISFRMPEEAKPLYE